LFATDVVRKGDEVPAAQLMAIRGELAQTCGVATYGSSYKFYHLLG
jgi:hypothetical protein